MKKPFYDSLKEIKKEISQSKDMRITFKAIDPYLDDPDLRREFFRNLDDPKWINLLVEKGLFKFPPKVKEVPEGGKQFPIWPASRYLMRMAKIVPDEVANIYNGIETENPSINCDIVDAAMEMPVDVAVLLVPNICRAAQKKALWISFKNACDFCVCLSECGYHNEAMRLAISLFKPKQKEDNTPTHQLDEYWYKKGMEKVVPILAVQNAKEFLPELCRWLKSVIEIEKHVDSGSDDDGSCFWRPAIEDHEQNKSYDHPGTMVDYVRDGFEEAIREKQLSIKEAFNILGDFSYLIFRRLRLHLINVFADDDIEHTILTMMERSLFDNREYKHEYAMLMGNRWDLLSPEDQATWLGWVDDGPDMSKYDDWIRSNYQREPTEADRKNRIEYWQFQRLHWIRNHLQNKRKEFYDRMLSEHGQPELADLNSFSRTGSFGSESPISLEDLKELPFEKAIEKVSSWLPEGSRFTEPSIEGLASTFADYVNINPVEFSMKANLLINRPAIYVRTFITQIGKALKDNSDINLDAILDLCDWVVGRPVDERTTPEQDHEGLIDKNWQWTREEIAHLIEDICHVKADESPKYPLESYRDKLWGLIKSLCYDRAESYVVHDVSKDDPRNHDYLNLGLNSPRGKAIKTALEYARWVANHNKMLEGDKKEVIPDGFDIMPEVREMLKWQMAPENRCIEVLAIIGSNMSLLYWIDKEWLNQKAEELFHLGGIENSPPNTIGWAAWNAFLVWTPPHIEYYKLFESQFAYAVDQIGEVKIISDSSREKPMNRLGVHLMILYGRGQLGLDDNGGMLRKFIDNANPSIRRHTLGFVGKSLKKDEDLPNEVFQRFMDLWDLYWAGPGKQDAQDKPNDYLFGPWFSCGKFPSEWSLERLDQFMGIVSMPQPTHAVAERLAEIADIDIAKSVQILDRAIRSDSETWNLHDWLEPGKIILKQAMKQTGETKDKAVGLIDFLGRKGYMEFGELLDK